jgi:hypothetical protein
MEYTDVYESGLCDFKRFLLKLSLLPRGIGPQRADTVSGMMAS